MIQLVLRAKYDVSDLAGAVTLSESLDEIAMTLEAQVMVAPDLQNLYPGPGDSIALYSDGILLFDGVIWTCESLTTGTKRLTVTAFDRTKYLAESEDEYLFPAGMTATQRLKRYAADWNIPLGQVADTSIKLAKAVYRAQPIYSMIQADLKETVKKGGRMYRPRMRGKNLDLVALGTNSQVWQFGFDNLEELTQKRTLDGAVTQVKVLGNAPEEKRSPVLAVVRGETAKYGTIQKVLSDSKVTTPAAAQSAGREMLAGMQESFTVVCKQDIPTIRAGDKVRLNNYELLVTAAKHELGELGRMTLDLASAEMVRRRYYGPD